MDPHFTWSSGTLDKWRSCMRDFACAAFLRENEAAAMEFGYSLLDPEYGGTIGKHAVFAEVQATGAVSSA